MLEHVEIKKSIDMKWLKYYLFLCISYNKHYNIFTRSEVLNFWQLIQLKKLKLERWYLHTLEEQTLQEEKSSECPAYLTTPEYGIIAVL